MNYYELFPLLPQISQGIHECKIFLSSDFCSKLHIDYNLHAFALISIFDLGWKWNVFGSTGSHEGLRRTRTRPST